MSMRFNDPVAEGLVPWYCNTCLTIPCHAFPSAWVQCSKGHKCSMKPSDKLMARFL